MAIIKSGTAASQEQYIDTLGASRVQLLTPLSNVTVCQFKGINFTAATSEGLVTLTPTRDFVESATGTSLGVTSGKRLRFIGLSISTKNAGAAVQGVQVRVRVNPAGAALVTSPVIAAGAAGTFIATANVAAGMWVDLTPLGIEIAGNNQFAISQIGTATAGNDVVLHGYEYTP